MTKAAQDAKSAETMGAPIADKDCQGRLKFETLLSNLSARFINLPGVEINHAIRDAQRQVCECLAFDMSVLWQWDPGKPSDFLLTHMFRPPGGPPLPERMNAAATCPWFLSQALAGKIVTISSPGDIPPEGARDLETWSRFGVKTTVNFPLSAGGGEICGVLSFNDIGKTRHWPEALVKRLALVAQIFANALVRHRAEQALRTSEALLNLAAESAGVGLWSLDLSSGIFWATDQAKGHFGFAPTAILTLDKILETAVPEDRDAIRGVIAEVEKTGKRGRVEYRIVHPQGGLRWLTSYGRVEEDPEQTKRLMGVTLDITDAKTAELELKKTLDELRHLRDQLQRENVYLQEQVRVEARHSVIVAESDAAQRMLTLARKVAPTPSRVPSLAQVKTDK